MHKGRCNIIVSVFFSFYYFFYYKRIFFSLTQTFNLLFCINTIKGPSLCRPAFPITTYTHTRYPYIIIFLLYERQFFHSLFFKSFLQWWRVPISVYQSIPTNSDVFPPFIIIILFTGFFFVLPHFVHAHIYNVPAMYKRYICLLAANKIKVRTPTKHIIFEILKKKSDYCNILDLYTYRYDPYCHMSFTL